MVLKDAVRARGQFTMSVERQCSPAGVNHELIAMRIMTDDMRRHFHRNVSHLARTSYALLHI